MKHLPSLLLALLLAAAFPLTAGAAVKFDERGITRIDGRPFFPVGIYLYDFNSDILAEVHQQGFNTIIWGASEKDLPTIKKHGLMWILRGKQALEAKDKSTILAWYPIDEPEDQKVTPEQVRADYDAIRAADPDRPIGICHYNLEMTKKFKDSEDFVMISAYPVDAARKNPARFVAAVGGYVDFVHGHRGKSVPVWSIIQMFGGPNTDNGRWALPTPIELRAMTYSALAHGAQGILFFSYWPQGGRTWAEAGVLAHELHRLTPFLVAPGEETLVPSSDKAVHTRCIKAGKSGIVIAVNTDQTFRSATLTLPKVEAARLDLPFENRTISVNDQTFTDRFMPYEVHVYQWGETPALP
jgi:hypothetical protein